MLVRLERGRPDEEEAFTMKVRRRRPGGLGEGAGIGDRLTIKPLIEKMMSLSRIESL